MIQISTSWVLIRSRKFEKTNDQEIRKMVESELKKKKMYQSKIVL